MVNILLIVINSLLNHSSMNYILLQWKLFMTEPNKTISSLTCNWMIIL